MPRVVVAMSGGVDSSVAAALLKQQGFECIGVHLNFWNDPEVEKTAAHIAQNKCCTIGGLEDARRVAAFLDIPFYVMNTEDTFKKNVVDYFIDEHAQGRTPNPCVECNRTIKFGQLLERAEQLGAEFVASGHYARVTDGDGARHLRPAVDESKDQSYFLYHLTQEKLRRIMFPIGEYRKPQIYELAKQFGLPRVIEKPQSQGLCFFSEASPKFFLKRYLDAKHFVPGNIVTTDGRIVGTHKGLPLYTVGQRGGLGIGGIKGEADALPWYVVRSDPKKNELVVGREADILEQAIVCESLDFVSGVTPTEPQEVTVRIRHRGELIPATLTVKDERATLTCHKPARGVAAGQAAVFYKDDEVIGGGIIVLQ